MLYDRNADSGRTSIVEWLEMYPFRQWTSLATWSAHRRRMPIRLIGTDRRLLEFSFSCPMTSKCDGRVLLTAAKQLLGPRSSDT